MRYHTSVSEEVIGSLSFRFHRLESFELAVDELYRELELEGRAAELERLCPYFGVLWPGARVLARWMLAQERPAFDGKRVLELGCGLALPSFVGAHLGARVVATDLHPDVPLFLARNLPLNPGTYLQYRHLDWSLPSARRETFDWILASDVLYEREQARTLAAFLEAQLSPGGEAILLDPNRSFWERLVGEAHARALVTHVERLPALHPDEPPSSVLIRVRRR